MPEPTEQEIRERARQIWERHGKPDGRDDEFPVWTADDHLVFEQELRNEDRSNPLRTPDTL